MFGLKFHHIGIACSDIGRTADFVLRTHKVTSDSGVVFDPKQNAELRIFNVEGPVAIELVAGAMVAKILERKNTYYHVCYVTEDIEATLAQAKKAGALAVSGPTEAILFGGRRVAFVYTPLGLVEFLEAAR